MAEAKTNEEINEEIRKMHADAAAKIADLERKKQDPEPAPEEAPQAEPLKVVPPKGLPTFDQWFKREKLFAELATISKRRGMLVPLITAYTNLDILRGIGAMAETLKKIPDLIQDQVDAIETMDKNISEKLDALISAIEKSGAEEKNAKPKAGGRKRTTTGE